MLNCFWKAGVHEVQDLTRPRTWCFITWLGRVVAEPLDGVAAASRHSVKGRLDRPSGKGRHERQPWGGALLAQLQQQLADAVGRRRDVSRRPCSSIAVTVNNLHLEMRTAECRALARIRTDLHFMFSVKQHEQYARNNADLLALQRLDPSPDRPVMASASTTASKVPRLPAPPSESASVYCRLPCCSSWRTCGACARL